MKKYYYTYLILNKINGKGYIGAHGTNDYEDHYLGSGLLILKAIEKYGHENFIRIILKRKESFQEAHLLESLYIKQFDTLQPNGYNICSMGGFDSMKGKKFTEEHKRKIAESHIGIKPTEETRKKLKENHYDCSGQNNGMYGQTHTKEAREKISKANKIKIKCQYCNKEFDKLNYKRWHDVKCKSKS